nr:RNA-directed DNA polymerase, eukaryota, reverse transcriptase zinc-binding domain protein [Tanacetum cinerariifolium]
MVRAKELFVWSPSFKDVPEVIQYSEVSSFKNAVDNNVEDIPDVNVEEESDCDAEVENFDIYVQSEGKGGRPVRKEGGFILDALDDMIKVGQAMGFTMDGCTNDME